MEHRLYTILYEIFKKELIKLNIGYEYNLSALSCMKEIIHAITYIKHGELTPWEAEKILRKYEEI